MFFSFYHRQLRPLGTGECIQVAFSVTPTSSQEFALEAIKNLIAVSIKFLCLARAVHFKVLVREAVSIAKLLSEVLGSL
jgi:hypothetical protein